jgi:hypothetical protein
MLGKTFTMELEKPPADEDCEERAPSSENSLFDGPGSDYDTFSDASSLLRALRDAAPDE